MHKTIAWGNTLPGSKLERHEIILKELGPDEMRMEVLYCGLCQSDLIQIDGLTGRTGLPLIPGHEVVGRVVSVGAGVDPIHVGSLRGLGWISGTCRHCQWCLSGRQTLCDNLELTVIGRTGGFANEVQAHQDWLIKIPDGIEPAIAGPLFCAGATVFDPLMSGEISPTASVAIIGIGGLGHLAVQITRAWGCHVTGITTSKGKEAEIRELGAHDVELLSNLHNLKGKYDLIINTSYHALDWDAVIASLAPQGRLHQLGFNWNPIPIKLFPFGKGNLSFTSSLTASPAITEKMLNFCARHNIRPKVEILPMPQINTAIERLRCGDARYRLVLQGPA
jgi:uncharacterized zinc-type alcohol dehydrogenase-like protein